MNPALKKYDEEIRVQVSKRLAKEEIRSIVSRFVKDRLTFAVSRTNREYEVWRQILPGDRPRIKNRKQGMTPNGIIEIDMDDLQARNFVCIWEDGKLVYGDPKVC